MPCCWAHSTCNTSAEVTLSSISSHSLRSPPTVTVTVPTTQPISSFTPHGMFLWCFQSVCAAAFTFSFLFLLCFLSGRLGRFFLLVPFSAAFNPSSSEARGMGLAERYARGAIVCTTPRDIHHGSIPPSVASSRLLSLWRGMDCETEM